MTSDRDNQHVPPSDHTSCHTSWPILLDKLTRQIDLTPAEAFWAMHEMIRGTATSAHISAFLIGLRIKGETPQEIRGLVQALYEDATTIDVRGDIVDIVGTGGDRTGAANISTMASIVVASTGRTVVKHGGRGSSSSCGSADVLEALGIDLELPPMRVGQIAEEVGITFCFAPQFHSGLRHVAPTRRALGIPTIINTLAPLINPARPMRQLVGVADPRMLTVIADVLADRGCSAVVARGDDGLDKISVTTTSQVLLVRDGSYERYSLDPRKLNIKLADPTDLRGGGTAQDNALMVRRVLAGERGALRDIVLLNAAAALVASSQAVVPLLDQLAEYIAQCEEALDSGAAIAKLERWITATQASASTESAD